MKSLQTLGFMLKTFAGDLEYVSRLVETFNRFNPEELPLVIVAPQADLHLFKEYESSLVSCVSDESIPVRYLTSQDVPPNLADPRPGRSPVGYLNQGISKLGFSRLKLFDHYVCLDSDTEFIRPIRRSDFMSTSQVPWFFAQDYSDLAADPFYSERYWWEREACLTKVRNALDLHDSPRLTVHNSLVMSAKVLENFEEEFLSANSLDFADLMVICPLEFFWYGVWMQKQTAIPLLQRGDIIRMINHQGEHLALFSLGIRKQSLANGYVGVIVNSNWSRQYGVVDFDYPLVADYFSTGDWSKWVESQDPDNLIWAQTSG